MQTTILYFPGIHREADELQYFFALMKEQRNITHTVLPVPYDSGKFSLEPFQKWLGEIQDKPVWWVGLSLGASMAWYLSATLPHHLCPKYLTVINPFSNRSQLAQWRGFSMEKQWNINNDDLTPPNFITTNAIISLQDTKIPLFCKQKMLDKLSLNSICYIEADHKISSTSAQQKIFDRLRCIDE